LPVSISNPSRKAINLLEQPTNRSGKLFSFVEIITEKCKEVGKKYNLDWKFLVGQAIYESGYGTSSIAVNKHNLFGIVGNNGYASFSSWEEAIDFQGFQLSQARYNKYKYLLKKGNYKSYGDAIRKAGYCKDRNYGFQIETIIIEQGLK